MNLRKILASIPTMFTYSNLEVWGLEKISRLKVPEMSFSYSRHGKACLKPVFHTRPYLNSIDKHTFLIDAWSHTIFFQRVPHFYLFYPL